MLCAFLMGQEGAATTRSGELKVLDDGIALLEAYEREGPLVLRTGQDPSTVQPYRGSALSL